MKYRNALIVILLFSMGAAPIVSAAPKQNDDGTYAFNERNVYLAWLKLQPDYDYEANKAELTKAFHWNRYIKNRDNEFSLQKVFEQSAKEVQTEVAKLPKAPIFRIRTSADFGDYNFDKGQFAFKPIEEGMYYSIKQGRHLYNANRVTTAIGYVLRIKDAVGIDGLSVPKDQAKAMVQRRTNSNGQVNRQVVVVYKIQAASAGTTTTRYQSDRVKQIKGKVISAKVYAIGSNQPVSDDTLLARWGDHT